MHSGLPGESITEHIEDAPSPLMGIGAILMFLGMFIMLFGFSLGENSKNPVPMYIGIGGAIMMFIGIAFVGIGYVLLERSWKKQDGQP